MKRLYQSRTSRIPGGIYGGPGSNVDTDPTIIRILWVALTFLSVGVGVIASIVAWILVPGEPEARDAASARS